MRRALSIRAAMVAAAAVLALSGCGGQDDAPADEGEPVTIDGVRYEIPLTRQLNPYIPPDDAYYQGEPPRGSRVLLGVFVTACNDSGRSRLTAAEFALVDGSDTEYRPKEPRPDNPFAYEPVRLGAERCTPEPGSVSDLAGSGKLLFFEVPLQAMQDRPLELEIAPGEPGGRTVELDI